MNESHSNASSSSSSSLNSSFQDTEDDQTIASILAADENSKLDGRLGRRLSHLDSIPHTPKVNGEIPDVNDATLDHGRLSERLATYGLAELQMEGDGNCQFRALADQLFRSPDYHKHVRKQVIKQLKHSRKLYEGYVPMEYRSYLKKMKKSGEWGDHITLQAAADRSPPFERLVILRSSPKTRILLEMFPARWPEKNIGFSRVGTSCGQNDTIPVSVYSAILPATVHSIEMLPDVIAHDPRILPLCFNITKTLLVRQAIKFPDGNSHTIKAVQVYGRRVSNLATLKMQVTPAISFSQRGTTVLNLPPQH
ncbi:hypothetical protein CJ030_MR6G010757 [Morella rubra]|uniref:OTU domain-containing protein n=1 Tax=Morella rubra TaxID=262757 RepID=A0A6A1VCQ2_9ROSI|nr:hypothetical protein CJ030_MR6G010757 [Morella rubra]